MRLWMITTRLTYTVPNGASTMKKQWSLVRLMLCFKTTVADWFCATGHDLRR